MNKATNVIRKSGPLSVAKSTIGAAVIELADRIDALESASRPSHPDSCHDDHDIRFPSVHQRHGETYLCAGVVPNEDAEDFSDTGLVVAFWASAQPDSTRWLDRDSARELRDWLTGLLEASR
jgi:hypothetical protein